MKIENVLIEGILPSGDGGDYEKGDLTPDEVVETINSFFKSYEKVAYVPNYPYGKTYRFNSPIELPDILNKD